MYDNSDNHYNHLEQGSLSSLPSGMIHADNKDKQSYLSIITKGGETMAKKGSKVSRLAVKEMVEGWEGRMLPKNISMKALIDMVMDEADIRGCRKEEDHGSRGAEAQNG